MVNEGLESFQDSDGNKVAERLEFEALSSVIQALQSLTPDARQRVLAAVITFLGLSWPSSQAASHNYSSSVPAKDLETTASFSEDRSPSPKEFLHEKRPVTDVDRIACLAYYLAHYRNTPHFKTLDLSKLNTEAAQLKLSNAAKSVENAARAGLLVPAAKGSKQLSARGELYVEALPDKTAAKAAIAHTRPKRKQKRVTRGGQQNGNGNIHID